MLLRSTLFLSFFSAAATIAPAQGRVWVVDDDDGPGVDFTEIQPAIDAAADGDLVLVEDGTYRDFTIDGKSLTLVGDAFSTVTVDSSTVTVRNLAPTQQVTLRNFVIDTGRLLLKDSAGAIWVEDVRVEPFLPTGVTVTDCDAVSLHDVKAAAASVSPILFPFLSVGNGGDALRVTGSEVFLFKSRMDGSDGSWFGGDAGDGIVLESGSLFLYGGRATGGEGIQGEDGGGGGPFQPPCSDGGDGGNGIHVASGATLRHLDTKFDSGSGAPGGSGTFGCIDGVDGLQEKYDPGSIVVDLEGHKRNYTLDSPVREGTTTMLSFELAQNATVLVLTSLEPSHVYVPALSGGLALGISDLGVLPAGNTDAAGNLEVLMTVPSLPPSVSFVQLFTQALFVEPTQYVIGQGRSLEILAAEY